MVDVGQAGFARKLAPEFWIRCDLDRDHTAWALVMRSLPDLGKRALADFFLKDVVAEPLPGFPWLARTHARASICRPESTADTRSYSALYQVGRVLRPSFATALCAVSSISGR